MSSLGKLKIKGIWTKDTIPNFDYYENAYPASLKCSNCDLINRILVIKGNLTPKRINCYKCECEVIMEIQKGDC